jgi:hypothetical protein
LLLLICPVLVRGCSTLGKALDCAVAGAGFAMCAAWVGLTFGLHLSHITSFSNYTACFVNNIARFVGNIGSFVNYIARFVSHITRFVRNMASFVNHIVNFVGNIGSFVKRGAYFSSYAALF